MQDVVARARVLNVESQVTTENVGGGDLCSRGEESVTPTTLHSEEIGGGAKNDALLEGVVLDERFFSGDDGEIADDAVDEYAITDYTAGQFSIHDRINHFMGAVPISLQNRVAVEASYMVEAVTQVRSMRSMRKTEIAPLVHDKYKSFIRMIPLQRFADATPCELRWSKNTLGRRAILRMGSTLRRVMS